MDTDTIIRIRIGNAYCYRTVLETVGVYHVPNKKMIIMSSLLSYMEKRVSKR